MDPVAHHAGRAPRATCLRRHDHHSVPSRVQETVVPRRTNASLPPTSEAKVLQALRAHPGSTSAELAVAAGVGRSTARRFLARAEQDGRAQRARGTTDGRGRADRWSPVTPYAAAERLGRGALREMVADFLAAHPETEFDPVAIGRALDRSSGAIARSLARLAGAGIVVRTREDPARYAIASSNEKEDEP